MLVHQNVNKNFDHTFGVVAEISIAALRVVPSISTPNKYYYGLQIAISGLGVCPGGFYVCKRTLGNEFIPSDG